MHSDSSVLIEIFKWHMRNSKVQYKLVEMSFGNSYQSKKHVNIPYNTFKRIWHDFLGSMTMVLDHQWKSLEVIDN